MKRSMLGILCLGLTSLTACGLDSEASPDDSVFRILSIQAVSGPLAEIGKAGVTGTEIAVEELNADGGILGRKVELKVLDSQGDPARAVTLLQKELSSGSKPDLVQAGSTSGESLALLTPLTQQKIVAFSNGGNPLLNDVEKYPYSFFIGPDKSLNSAYLADQLNSDLSCENVGLFFSNDATGSARAEQHETAFEEAGLQVSTQSFDPTTLDLSSSLARLKDYSPDCVVYSALGVAPQNVLKAAERLSWDIPLIGDDIVTGDLGALNTPDEVETAYLFAYKTNVVTSADEQPAFKKTFLEQLAAKTKVDTSLINYSWSHDILRVVAMGFEQAGSTEAEKVKDALEDLEQPDELPYLSFADMAYSKDSHFVSSKPEDFVLLGPGISPIEAGRWTLTR